MIHILIQYFIKLKLDLSVKPIVFFFFYRTLSIRYSRTGNNCQKHFFFLELEFTLRIRVKHTGQGCTRNDMLQCRNWV